jgi:hypothetical protein
VGCVGCVGWVAADSTGLRLRLRLSLRPPQHC